MRRMDERIERLRKAAAVIHDLEKAAALLSWDEETKMPPGGAEARAEQRATLHRLAHERLISDETARLLADVEPLEADLDYDSDEASLVRVLRRDHEKARRVPPELHAEMVRSSSRGYRAWLNARENEDFEAMLPHYERGLDLRRRYVECFDGYDDPYDVLLDDYEPGMTTAEVDDVFEQLKTALVPMIHAVAELEPVDDSFIQGGLPIEPQRRFSAWALERLGFEDEHWRLDDTVHPFASSTSHADIRLTTRFRETDLGGVLACFHEFGHGLYERQVAPELQRSPLASGVSAALHESQSRMWENLVGRGIACWRYMYPRLREELGDHLGSVPVEAFHRAINKVQPSYVRVEADEVTYNLHIILRFELERDLLGGRLDPRDLRDAFDAKMHDYLGLTPPDLKHGVLQDVHWSDFSFGYFPTYALGNVISVQIWERVKADVPDLEEQFERGEFRALREWTGEHVHRYGRKYTPQETVQRAAGGPIDAGPYLGYLERKLADVFGAAVA
jgi:carboxypeptidase Taq